MRPNTWGDPERHPPSWRSLKNFSSFSKIVLSLIFLMFLTYIVYSSKYLLISSKNPLPKERLSILTTSQNIPPISSPPRPPKTTNTTLQHIVFGIAGSSGLWEQRKNYISLWYKPNKMRAIVWLDTQVQNDSTHDHLLPPRMISSDTSKFKNKHKGGHRSATRISRIVSEMFRLGLKDVRWFVMGDDDTFFVPENLVTVLSKYDHTKFYYIGTNSESHLQNINFSYGMAYGGGGFAISYPLAKALEKMQDRCIQRYPKLYGSDDRIQACMAELGVSLTKEPGFHQFDVYGSVFGLLAAHPMAPLVSLHHLDIIEPIFPKVDRVQALQRLAIPESLDSAALMQQSICYDHDREWTVSVSWGYAVQIIRGIIPPFEMERPGRTFLNWYRKADFYGFAFNTRPLARNSCQRPFVYYLSNIFYDDDINRTSSEYLKLKGTNSKCKWKMDNPSKIGSVVVYKTPDPYYWEKNKRRNCCSVLPAEEKGTLLVDVRECGGDEVIESR